MDRTTQASVETLPEGELSGDDRPTSPTTAPGRRTIADIIAEAPLATLYARIQKAVSPYGVLGVTRDCTRGEIREVYHALALRIHPDKVPKDDLKLRELHTESFQKVQGAYALVKEHCKLSGECVANPKQFEEELRARVLKFKDFLRAAREDAVAYNSGKASKRGCVKMPGALKNEKFGKFTKIRQNHAEREQERETRAIEALERRKENERPLRTSLVKAGRQDDLTVGDTSENGEPPHKKVARRSYLALETLDPSVRRAVLAARYFGWSRQLLSGGTSGSVSFVQMYERENNAMAQGLDNAEYDAEAETARALEEMGPDVLQYLISEEDIKHWSAPLGEFLAMGERMCLAT